MDGWKAGRNEMEGKEGRDGQKRWEKEKKRWEEGRIEIKGRENEKKELKLGT